jgi:hypothetical protein
MAIALFHRLRMDPRPADRGDVWRVEVEWRNGAGDLIDPTTVTFKHIVPGSTTPVVWIYDDDPQPTKVGVGIYRADLTLSASGVWEIRWEAAGTNAGAVESSLTVKPSNF